VLVGLTVACAAGPAAPVDPAEVPDIGVVSHASDTRLIVLISVDQMIPEQLERLASSFKGGFGRLLSGGRNHRDAALTYFDTETGPGHATLGTGCQPRVHGVVSNAYLDRDLGRWVYCVSDPDVRALYDTGLADSTDGSKNRHRVSAKCLRVPTLGEYLAAAYPGSRTVSISPKDRAAITMAGRAPGWALWWDKYGRGFVSSSAWGNALPEWVGEWNRGGWEAVAGRSWEPLSRADEATTGTAPDDREGEAKLPSGRKTFPHVAPDLGDERNESAWGRLCRWIYQSPDMDRFVVELALAALEGEDLGSDDTPDLLALSFSACDTVGHASGPYSAEVTDVLLRLDRQLERLFTRLDERVGAGRWVLALSSDHGVLRLPEGAPEGVPGGRTSSNEHKAAVARVKEALVQAFGEDFKPKTSGYGLYLDAAALAAATEPTPRVRAVARDAFLEAPQVLAAWTLDELREARSPAKRVVESPSMAEVHREFVLASFLPERSADVIWLPREGYLHLMKSGTTHGTSHAYDRRVPLIFYGAPFTPGDVRGPADAVDAVPTLLHALGIEIPPSLDGRVLPLR
jgi:hypothetical protein